MSQTWSSQFVEGFRFPGMMPAEVFRSALKYQPRDDDIFVASYLKCGTTWTIYTLDLIFRQGEPFGEDFNVIEFAPFLEVTGPKVVENMKRPGAIKTHLPHRLTPWSDKAKYIHVTRNPKDACVSFYYHMRDTPGHGLEGTFDDFFEHYLSGDIDFGDYYDHLLGWYEHRNDPNVLFITYEEMMAELDTVILKMASFIDDEKYAEPLRKDRQKLEKVMKYCGLEEMRETFNKNIEKLFAMSVEDMAGLGFSEMPEGTKEMFAQLKERQALQQGSAKPKPVSFIRKGIVGDWRNHFSEEQSRRMNEKFAEKTKGTEIANLWKEHMSDL